MERKRENKSQLKSVRWSPSPSVGTTKVVFWVDIIAVFFQAGRLVLAGLYISSISSFLLPKTLQQTLLS